MQKSSDIKELFQGGSKRLTSLKNRLQERSRVLDEVIAALPAELAATVTSAGLERGKLTLSATSAVWATRLRYAADALRQRVEGALGVEIISIRIKVAASSKT